MRLLINNGTFIDPFRPQESNYTIETIAHALSNLCRFSGHTREFYSVAQHSVHVQDILAQAGHAKDIRLAGLLHDAHEAFTGDIARPLKASGLFRGVEDLEHCLDIDIAHRFGCLATNMRSVLVRVADDRMLAAELRDLMPDSSLAGVLDPWEATVRPWSPVEAKNAFLEVFEELTR